MAPTKSKYTKFIPYKDETSYRCAKCDIAFKSRTEYRDHNDRKHPLRRSY